MKLTAKLRILQNGNLQVGIAFISNGRKVWMTLICQNHISHKSRKPDQDDSLSQNVNDQVAEARWLPDEEGPASEQIWG